MSAGEVVYFYILGLKTNPKEEFLFSILARAAY